jgi:chorismate synthase
MNTYGKLFQVTLYGESHQPTIGVVVDGVKPGTTINLEAIKHDLALRRPGKVGTTPRIEEDLFQITAGLYQGVATGSPIHLMIPNENVQSKDYDHLKTQPRPGHADFVAHKKYHGFQDPRGGGRFSGRLTAAMVAAGAIAKMTLPYKFSHRLIQIGQLKQLDQIDTYLSQIQKEEDSVGGIIEVRIQHVPIGLGEPMFHKLDAEIAKMLMSMPAVKAVGFGDAFSMFEAKGSEYNDVFEDELGHTLTNHSGGVSGGISNGNDIVVQVFIKPTSSIQKAQYTYDQNALKPTDLKVGGRHDVAIVRRAGIVMENVCAIVLADLHLLAHANGA